MPEAEKTIFPEVKEIFLKVLKWIAVGLLGILTLKHFSAKSSSNHS